MAILVRCQPRVSALIAFTVIAGSAFPAAAVSINQVPNPRQTSSGWVTDMADILSEPTEAQLNQMISALESNNGSEIAVVTVPETAPSASPKAFATQLFNTWGIGKKSKDNGVLFLISKRDRKLEIETGYGVEAILPNANVQQLIDSQIIPSFKQGNFDRGTLNGTTALVKALRTDGAVPQTGSGTTPTLQAAPKGTPLIFDRLMLPLTFGAGLLAIGGWVYRRTRGAVLLKPGGRSRTQRQAYSEEQTKRQPRCSCRTPLQKVSAQALFTQLTAIEQAALALGSVKYLGWQCPTCQTSTHIRAYVWNDTVYKKCPHCQDLTMTFALNVLAEATREAAGRQQVTETCTCCDHHREYEESISRLPDPTYAAAGAAVANNGWSQAHMHSGGGASGGSSGGGFGGGSSGGGGAGGSW
jgi:uncharacterized protein